MTTGLMKEQNLEKQIQKQMGCMAGFLQIFDRHHILTGKRLQCARRLPISPPAGDTASESESGKSAPSSPAVSGCLGKQPPAAELPAQPTLPLPIFEAKDGVRSSWKFGKETPRLSLDSRATTDAKGGLHPKEIRIAASILPGDVTAADAADGGQQHRSPSVIARLMGLEPLPNSTDSPPETQPELRRSASESRVSKDLFQSRLMTDGSSLYSKPPKKLHPAHLDNATINSHYADPRNQSVKKGVNTEVSDGLSRGSMNSMSQWRAPQPRKSFFDSGDVFPEPKQNVSIYGEIEKRLKMRGIDEPSKDLETLKQILEALQLKGLLHSKPPPPPPQNQVRHRNIVYDNNSPIVLMKPARPSPSKPINRYDFPQSNGRKQVGGLGPNHNFTGETSSTPSPRRERNVRSPTRSGRSPSPTSRSMSGIVNGSRSNSPVKSNQPLTQRRVNEYAEQRRSSPVHSPKLNGTGPDRSPRFKKPTVAITKKPEITTVIATEDAYSSVSGSSATTSTDTERCKTEEYKEGKSLLERCDKLLHSIAEFAATDMQPSPVSVLDSSFYKDDSFTPSPVTTKRNIDFKDQYGESEEEIMSPIVSPIRSKCVDSSQDYDFVYVSDILRATHCLPDDSDVFLLLEKQQHLKGNDTSKISRVQRKLIFDTISEILDRDARLPPWKAVASKSHYDKASLDKVWSEFQRIRECDIAEDLFETICRVLKKDLAGDAITGWGDCPVEMSEVVLDIERLVFKDMVSEIIEDLSLSSSSMMPRRKLVF